MNENSGPAPRVIGIVLARQGSSRLPGKALVDVAGRPMVWHILQRLASVKSVQQTVLATTDRPEDRAMAEVAAEAGAAFFQGAEEDVLDRFYQAARLHQGDTIVHVGGDCPFVDPDMVVELLDLITADEGLDMVTNIMPQTYPSGIDLDIVRFPALERAWREASLSTERHHLFQYLYGHPKKFRIHNVRSPQELVHLRWTLDYPEDLDLVRAVYQELYSPDKHFHIEDILELLERRPELKEINQHLHLPVSGQPAFWDAEGVLRDMRCDLQQLVESAVAADSTGRWADASRDYQAAARVAAQLEERVRALSSRSTS